MNPSADTSSSYGARAVKNGMDGPYGMESPAKCVPMRGVFLLTVFLCEAVTVTQILHD